VVTLESVGTNSRRAGQLAFALMKIRGRVRRFFDGGELFLWMPGFQVLFELVHVAGSPERLFIRD